MLESSYTCPTPNYSYIMHSLEETTSLLSQYHSHSFGIKSRINKIKTEVKEIKNQLSIIHLFLINKIRNSGKFDLIINTSFQHKYHWQNQKNKNQFPLEDIRIEKEAGEK